MKRNNPKLYRELSAPFATDEDVNAALENFYEAVHAARVLFRIPDVHIVALVNVASGEDDEYSSLGRLHLGNPQNAPQMLAYALAREEEAQRDVVTRARARKAAHG